MKWYSLRRLVVVGLMVSWAAAAHAESFPSYQRLLDISGLRRPTRVSAGLEGNVYINSNLNTAAGRVIQVFSPRGSYVSAISLTSKATALKVAGNGLIYAGESGRVEVFSGSSLVQTIYGVSSPAALDVTSDGTVYVLDAAPGVSTIKVFNEFGVQVSTIGSFDVFGPSMYDMVVDEANGELYVLDRNEAIIDPTYGTTYVWRIVVFDLSGTFLRSFSHQGYGIEGLVASTIAFTVDDQRRVYVADNSQDIIVVYDHLGAYLGTMFDLVAPYYDPTGITFRNDRLYFVSYLGQTATVLGIDAYADLSVSPSALALDARGRSVTGDRSITIANTGAKGLSWSASSDASWLLASVSSGNVPGGGNAIISAVVDPVGLPAGTSTGYLTINSNGGYATVAVTVTVIPVTKIGIFQEGLWYLDATGSWDWNGAPPDILGVFGVGLAGAIPVVGDWNGDGKSEIGVFIDGIWYLDMNGNWQWDGEGIDVRGVFGVGLVNAKPVVGDWNGDGTSEIGVYIDGIWYLDMNRNWQWDGEGTDVMGVFGVGLTNAVPVTGDWDGLGSTKIGIYSDGSWYLDVNQNWQWDDVPGDTFGIFGVGLTNAVPVTGDWDGRGSTGIGIYTNGYWYLDTNRSWDWNGTPTDTFGVFGVGLTGAAPVTGTW